MHDCLQFYYWGGFLLADGSKIHNGIRLHLARKDRDHLDKYRQFINLSENKIIDCNYEHPSSYIDLYGELSNNFIEIFGWNDRKTYNPPNINTFIKFDDQQFLSSLVGYIDGDGTIQKQVGRQDCFISIHVHKNWLDLLLYCNERLYDIFNFTKIKPPHILSSGYLRYNIGCIKTLINLKKFSVDNDLPVLFRKWDRIDLNYTHRKDKKLFNKQKVRSLQKEGRTIKDISNIMNVPYNTVCYYLYH